MKKLSTLFLLLFCLFMLSACGIDPESPPGNSSVGAVDTTGIELPSSDSAAALTATSPTPLATPSPSPTPTTDWVTVFVAFENYHEGELEGIIDALDEAGYRSVITSTQTGTAKGMGGGNIVIETAIDEIEDLGLGIVIAGGSGVVDIWNNETLLELVRRADEKGLLVAGICAGPGVLGNAGVLIGKSASWYDGPNTNAVMCDAGCENSGQAVTIDGNSVTGNGPSAAIEFGKAIVEVLDSM